MLALRSPRPELKQRTPQRVQAYHRTTMEPIRTDFRGYEGRYVAIDALTGEVVIAEHASL